MTTTHDPRFPNRPDHPDFAWLSRTIQEQDAASEEPGFSVDETLAALPIDPASLTYLAQQRGIMAMNHLIRTGVLSHVPARIRAALEAVFASAYLDAFTLGVRYGREAEQDGRR